MCGDQSTVRQIREYLETKHIRADNQKGDPADDDPGHGPSAQLMMRRKLREYLLWKPNFKKANENLYGAKPKPKGAGEVPGYSSLSSAPAGRYPGRAPPNKRRRIRGGSSAAATPSRTPIATVQPEVEEAPLVTELLEEIQQNDQQDRDQVSVVVDDLEDMEDFYELYDMNHLVIIHTYGGDMDERILEEARPRYIIMYEPDAAFIRRVEVYRSSHTNRDVRVYFMYYSDSVEERKYLSAVRREKDAFTKLIKEKGVRCLRLL